MKKRLIVLGLYIANLWAYNPDHVDLVNKAIGNTQALKNLPDNLDLSCADFRSKNLAGANLNGANFQNAYLSYTDFRGCTITKANFKNAFLLGSRFQEAVLSETRFTNAVLNNANFHNAQGITIIDWPNTRGTKYPNGQIYKR